jgi:predicted nicotinamide N-methyase
MTLSVLPPSAQLPPIETIKTVHAEQLHEAVQYLQTVYNPEIRSSRRTDITVLTHGPSFPSPAAARPTRPCRRSNQKNELNPGGSGRRPSDDDDDDGEEEDVMESFRTDAFERAYAIRWLTALISSQTTILLHDHDHDHGHHHHQGIDKDALEPLVQSAVALLAVCAGPASAGKRTRTYVLAGVRVQLTDVALRNDDFGSVGAQTWGSACVLAEMIAEAPWRFGLSDRDCVDGGDGGGKDDGPGPAPKKRRRRIRVLELGAGTGLVSLTVGKVLSRRQHQHQQRRRVARGKSRCPVLDAEIVASDFHPIALENLKLNIEKNDLNNNGDHDDCHSESTPARCGNDDDGDVSVLSVSAHFLDWEEAGDPAHVLGAPFDAPFDEAFGADVVYEPDHAAWINACLKRLLRLSGRFHLVIPLRKGFAHESASVERVFPHAEDIRRVIGAGPILCITQKENITCEVGPEGAPGGEGHVEYAHYTIQWVVRAGLHEE